MNISPAIELIEYTDPYCTWCWGSEPILRHIQEVYKEQVHVSFVMGGLTDNTAGISDPANGIGGADWKHQVAAHWLDASSQHGMPVDVSKFVEIVAPISTYPANIAYEAAKLQDPKVANSYLRRLRELAATESGPIHLPQVQADLAEELGLDRKRFLVDLAGPAKVAFEADRRLCLERDIRGFPTFLVRKGKREQILRGYHRFEAFEVAIELIAGRELVKRQLILSRDAVLEFVRKYGNVATREVAELFGVADDKANTVLNQLVTSKLIELHRAGTGNMYRDCSR